MTNANEMDLKWIKNNVFESKVGIVNRIDCILYAEKMYFAFYQSHVWRFSKNKKNKNHLSKDRLSKNQKLMQRLVDYLLN